MPSFSRQMLQSAAAMGIAATLSLATPAVAADSSVPASQVAAAQVAAKPAPTAIKRHASHRVRHYASYHDRLASHLGCSGVWCGRQFVLMVGVAY